MIRDRTCYISRPVWNVIRAIAHHADKPLDEIADKMLSDLLREKHPDVVAFYDDYEQREKAFWEGRK